MNPVMNRRRLLAGAGAALGTLALGIPTLNAAYSEAAVEGGATLKGVLRLTGAPPVPDEISISKDGHICGTGAVHPNPLHVGTGGGLRDGVAALRAVKSGKPWAEALTAPKVTQADCRFHPFVQVAPKGAELTVFNKDPLLHNIHAYELIGRARRTLFNIAQPAAGQIDTAVLKMRRGSVVEIDCDAHNWMSCWIFTADHPYLAVTDPNGRFEIAKVPPGAYELVFWHPVLGERTREITLAASQTIDLSLDMTA